MPPSAACLEVCSTLDSLEVQHERRVLVHGGFLLADVLLPEHGIALLVEGQGCYVRNTGRRRGEPVPCWCYQCEAVAERCQCAGEAVAMDRLFVAAGLQPVAIGEVHWQGLGSLSERQACLRSLLPAGMLDDAA